MKEIKIELLRASFSEHFKYAKELGLIVPINNPRRLRIEKEGNKIQEELNKLLNEK